MKQVFLGDVHAKIDEIPCISNLIQVGDMGVGFREINKEMLPPNFRFIRGNHDSPDLCKLHPCYLGDYGYLPEGIFFFSGALSIDKHLRKENVDWWRDEELGYREQQEAAEIYEKEKPMVVVTHTAPYEISRFILGGEKVQGNTEKYLQFLFDLHKPRFWIFGHFHESRVIQVKDTTFVCLEELGLFTVEV